MAKGKVELNGKKYEVECEYFGKGGICEFSARSRHKQIECYAPYCKVQGKSCKKIE